MLEALKFVRGAVAKKDFVPALTHFRIKNHKVMGFNGSLAISSPIPCDLDISPNAVQLVKALDACTETVSLHVNRKGKLVVQSGSFQTFVDCDDPANFPEVRPTGQLVVLNPEFIKALALLEPIVAIDASRPWACGLLFNGESAYATNNIILIQYWLGHLFPCRVNIPSAAIRELVRVGEPPDRLQVTDSRLVFHYPNGRWLATQVIETPWPVSVEPMLDEMDFTNLQPVAPTFWDALEHLAPFCDEVGRGYFQGNHISTIKASEDGGAGVAQDCPEQGIFNVRQLLALRELATEFGWDRYPDSVPFTGPACRGVVAGIRDN